MEQIHRMEYAKALERLRAKCACNSRSIRYIGSLFDEIDADPESFDREVFYKSHVRAIHDRVGWMAKDTPERLGACSGAIYRTEGFMRIPPEQRVGSKRGSLPKNIHIEHTIPAHHLALAFARKVDTLRPTHAGREGVASDLLAWFMNHSVCTAMSHEEEKLIAVHCHRNLSPCFDDTGLPTNEPFPFRRYLSIAPALRIFNVVTSEWILLETWSLDDHRDTFNRAGVYYLGAAQDGHRKDTRAMAGAMGRMEHAPR